MQKPQVYLTFDIERDYVKTGHFRRPSFEGIRSNVPRILDKMHENHIIGTFFLTPEVIANCEDLVAEIKRRHAVGLHSHAYYQPEFKGWNADGDSLACYSPDQKTRMILRDIGTYRHCLGKLRLFRIGRLEPDQTILKVVSEEGCQCDSSYHATNYGLLERLRVALKYDFKEKPVKYHLYGLEPSHLMRDQAVILVHPLTPPGKSDKEVYDENHLMRMIDISSRYCDPKDLTSCINTPQESPNGYD